MNALTNIATINGGSLTTLGAEALTPCFIGRFDNEVEAAAEAARIFSNDVMIVDGATFSRVLRDRRA